MAIDSSDLVVARVGDKAYAIATGVQKTALEGQALDVTTDAAASFTWTNGLATITGASDAGDIGRWLFNVTTFDFYEIIGAIGGVNYTLDRVWDGTSGARDTIIFTPNGSDDPIRSGFVWGGEL